MLNTPISRRTYLAASATAALAAGASFAAEEKPLPYIDAHSHIWTRDIEKYPLDEGKTLEDMKPASFTAEELLGVANKHDVGKVVLIQHHPLHGWDNSYIVDSVKKYPDKFRAVGMINYAEPKPGEKMKALLKHGVTGFRVTPKQLGAKWLGEGLPEMHSTAAETGQNICYLINPEHIEAVAGMCKRFPDTPIVIDHFARVGISGEINKAQLRDLAGLSRYKNVKIKVSAYYALGEKKPPYTDMGGVLLILLADFGPERLMWASDSPYETAYTASIDLVRKGIPQLSADDKEWLLTKTAAKTFFFA